MKMRINSCFGDRTRSGTFSDEDNSVSRTDNFMNVSRVLFFCSWVLHQFWTMPLSSNFNLTYGLKPQVSGIEIATVYRRSIFQVEWLIATLILYVLILCSFLCRCLQKVTKQQREIATFRIFENRELYDGQFLKFLFRNFDAFLHIFCLGYFWQCRQTEWI